MSTQITVEGVTPERVAEILTLADAGHQLYEMSGAWKVLGHPALTVEDLQRALDDERHHGWGYACVDSRSRKALDPIIVKLANRLGLDYEALFDWTNSKYGRWLNDAIEGNGMLINDDTVAQYLHASAVREARV